MIVLALALLTIGGCSSRSPAGDGEGSLSQSLADEATPTPVATAIAVAKPTYAVARGDVIKQLVLGGRIMPVRQEQLFFRMSGRVKTVFVKNGEHVTAGMVLAELEMDNAQRDLAGGKLDLERAQARLKAAGTEVQENVRRSQANLDIAKENLAITLAQDPAPRKAQAEAALQRAALALKQAQADYDAVAWRNDKGTTPQAAALEQATIAYAEARAAHDLALQDIAAYAHQVNIARRQVDLAQIALDGANRGVDPLLANDVQRAQFAVDKLEAAVADARITAPFEGDLDLAFALVPGQAIEAYKYVITLSDPKDLEVSVETVTANDLEKLSENMPVTVSLTARPGVELKAHVRRLPSAALGADTDRSLRVALDAGQSGYANGDLVRMTAVVEQRYGVLWLPPQAIRTFDTRKFVVMQDGALQKRVDVKIGVETTDRVEILSGLTEGQLAVAQ